MQIIKAVEESEAFQEWKAKHTDAQLMYIFAMHGADGFSGWQVGYAEGDNVTPFLYEGERVSKGETEEMFKKPGESALPLTLSEAQIPVEEAMQQAQKEQQEKYPKEKGERAICILQNLKKYGIVWNITFITYTMKTLNIKVDARNGDILVGQLLSLFDIHPGKK
mgnify:CR=1 FL=1